MSTIIFTAWLSNIRLKPDVKLVQHFNDAAILCTNRYINIKARWHFWREKYQGDEAETMARLMRHPSILDAEIRDPRSGRLYL